MKFAILTSAGIPSRLSETESAPEGATILPENAALEVISRQMFIDGAWQDRPAARLDLALGSPARVTLVSASEPATVTIFDLDADEPLAAGLAAPGDHWEFPDPGRYAVEVDPALPWLPAVLRFEVPE
jgi:hypothetical protein